MDIRGRKMRKPPACVQCRKRKIGCDRVKPICGNCRKGNKGDCFYPDVPGRYVPSTSSKPNEKNISIMGNYGQITHSKEATSILQHNPELASLEQIRDYNTRLQLLNSQENRVTPSPLEHAQFIPRIANFENKTVSSANNTGSHLNWVQGPAIFDQMTAPYTQEEVILKEMCFLKARLQELQEITGKQVTGIDFSSDETRGDNNDEDNLNKRRKVSMDGDSNDNDNDLNKLYETIDEFKDLDPEFLDYTQVFSVFGSKNLPLPNFIDSPNSLFTNNFLTMRDSFTYSFRKLLTNVVKNNFEPNLAQWQQQRVNNTVKQMNISLSSSFKRDDNKELIKFPSRPTIQDLISKFVEIGKDMNILIPILKTKELFSSIEQSFGREPIFKPSDLNIGQLITFGQISSCLLFTYESLSSSVLIILKDEQLESFHQLKKFLPNLLNNIELIKSELDIRKGSLQSVETLKFIVLYKFYQSITTLSVSSDSDKINNHVDFDEDVHLALHQSINDEQKDESSILLWNFIYKNYCWRHFFRGEIPIMMSGQRYNSAPIVDTLLSTDFGFLSFQMDLLQYLQSKDQVISLQKVLRARELFKVKFNAQSKRCLTSATITNHVSDTAIYRKSMLYIDYFLLLQYEILKDSENFVEIYTDFLQLLQDTIFFTFSNLANKNLAGYEFLYINKLFATLSCICDMLLGLYQRNRFAFNDISQVESSNEHSSLTQEQADHISLVVRKLLMLLEDYTKNCKVITPMINNVIIKIKTIISYCKLTENERKPNEFDESNVDSINSPSDNAINADFEKLKEVVKKSLQHVANAFENIDEADMTKFNNKIKTISESLIVSQFYNNREPFKPTNIETLGITTSNFSEVFNALD